MNIFGQTHVGEVRLSNQDRFVCETLSQNSAVLCVCDGMGGENGGEIASKYAIETFVHHLKSQIIDNFDENHIANTLRHGVEYANNYVYQIGLNDENLSKMGTTLVGGIFVDNFFYVANIGDSRCYHICRNGITQVTRDHSVVQEILENSDISYLKDHFEPLKKYLTKAIGHITGDDCDIFKVDLQRDDIILLCSDGLHNLVSDDDILHIALNGSSTQEICDTLINTANENGGLDNVTVAVLKY